MTIQQKQHLKIKEVFKQENIFKRFAANLQEKMSTVSTDFMSPNTGRAVAH